MLRQRGYLVESWVKARKYFPVSNPLFRSMMDHKWAVWSINNGFKNRKAYHIRKASDWDKYGVSFSRNLDFLLRGRMSKKGGKVSVAEFPAFGNYVFVVDANKLKRKFATTSYACPQVAKCNPKLAGSRTDHGQREGGLEQEIDWKAAHHEYEEKIHTDHIPAKYIEGIVFVVQHSSPAEIALGQTLEGERFSELKKAADAKGIPVAVYFKKWKILQSYKELMGD